MRLRTCTAVLTCGMHLAAPAANAADDAKVLDYSLEDLMNTTVTTVSKSSERAFTAPAAVYVITNEDLHRTGVKNIPDALRMVPGMQVAQVNANGWAISARGFNFLYSDKLQVMIDGRSVYNPHFSGVSWDMMDLPLEDIDRIEVIRGPGASIWGANAVNGVINIVRKHSKDTQGDYIATGYGMQNPGFGEWRHGGTAGNSTYRVYAKADNYAHTHFLSGAPYNDAWYSAKSGFRVDAPIGTDKKLMVLGDVLTDYYDLQSPASEGPLSGKILSININTQLQKHIDKTQDLTFSGFLAREEIKDSLWRPTTTNLTLEVDHNWRFSDRDELVWGGSYKIDFQEYGLTDDFFINPNRYQVQVLSMYAQDNHAIIPDELNLIVGSKFEYNTYTAFEAQPTIKAVWQPTQNQAVWASVARAVRTPYRFENNVRFNILDLPPDAAFPGSPPAVVQLWGQQRLPSEVLHAYEIGYRVKPSPKASVELAAYYDDYNHNLALKPLPPLFTVDKFGNPIVILANQANRDGRGAITGFEANAVWNPVKSWRLQGSYTFILPDLKVNPPSMFFADYNNDTPEHQFNIRSYWDITDTLQWDVMLYWVDALHTDVSTYTRVDTRLGWKLNDRVECNLIGQNLFGPDHQEIENQAAIPASSFGKNIIGQITLRF